jgi:hypothetical protein
LQKKERKEKTETETMKKPIGVCCDGVNKCRDLDHHSNCSGGHQEKEREARKKLASLHGGMKRNRSGSHTWRDDVIQM